MLDDESRTSTNLGNDPNLGNDHGFINKEYSPHWYETFWGMFEGRCWMMKVAHPLV